MPKFVAADSTVWKNVYLELDIPVGTPLMLQNIGQEPLAFAVIESSPTRDDVDLVADVDSIIEVAANASGLWVLQHRGSSGQGLLVGRTKTDFRKLRPYTGFDQIVATGGGGGSVTSHSALTDLDADDHVQYFNAERGDARYARASHVQAMSTITGLSDALLELTNAVDNRVIKVVGMGLSANDFTDLLLAKLNSLPQGNAGKINWTDIMGFVLPTHGHTIADVGGLQTALDAKAGTGIATTSVNGLMSAADKAKVDGVAAGATANATNAQLRDRATHTGAQAISTVTGLQTALDAKQNAEAGKGLSTNDYTNAEKAKLASLESGKYKGVFASLAALQAGVVTPAAGDYADVDAGAGSDVVRYLYDLSDTKWVAQTAGGGSMTGAQIATALFAEPDTNRYTDAEEAKLAGIAAGATANATNAQLRDRATHTGAQAISTVTGLQTALDAKAGTAIATTSASGLMSAADKTKVDGVAANATANATDAQLRDRATHTGAQAISTVTGLQTALDAKAGTAVATTTVNGLMSAADKTKLNGIATGATVNATDAQLRDRSTHTGTQDISTVSGLQTALDGKAGTAVATTTVNGLMSATDKTKLNGVAANATANATDAQLRDRTTHTGAQAISTVTGLQTALDNKAASSHTHSISEVVGLTAQIAALVAVDESKQKIIVQSPTAPASPAVGDLWIQIP